MDAPDTKERELSRRPAKPQILDGLIGLDELKNQLEIKSRQTIHSMLARGLPSIKLGKRRLFLIEDVRAWILSHQVNLEPRKPGRPRQR
jgi:hypothetical protein